MSLPRGQAQKRKIFNHIFFLIMNLVKARNLKTIGIRERKEIKHWGSKRKYAQKVRPVHYSRRRQVNYKKKNIFRRPDSGRREVIKQYKAPL